MKYSQIPLTFLLFFSIPTAFAQTCHATENCIVQDGGMDATCTRTGSSATAVINCNIVSCESAESCRPATIENSENVQCSALQSCQGASISNAANLVCSADYSCDTATILNSGAVECAGGKSCRDATIEDSTNVECTESNACQFAIIATADSIKCSATLSCKSATIEDTQHVKCIAQYGCDVATIKNVADLKCSARGACYQSTISEVPIGATIDCGHAGLQQSYACYEATIESTNPFTLTCAGALGASSRTCIGRQITNPGGSIFCYGGTAIAGTCDTLPIADSFGCIICGSQNACKDVTIVSGKNGKTIKTLPEDEVFVHNRCDASDILEYMNKVHPDGGRKCQDTDDNDNCDVIEAYCARNKEDVDCIGSFQILPGSVYWTKLEVPEAAIDPDALLSGGANGDNGVSKDSWIVGSVVIAVVLALMAAVVVSYRGQEANEESDFAKEEQKDGTRTNEQGVEEDV